MSRDLASGHEIELPTPGLLKTGLTYGADGRTLFFLGAREGNDTRTDVYLITETADGPALAVDAGGLKAAPLIDPGGAAIVYVIPNQSPLRRPVFADDESAGRRRAQLPRGTGDWRRSTALGAGSGHAIGPSTFAVVDLRSNACRCRPGRRRLCQAMAGRSRTSPATAPTTA